MDGTPVLAHSGGGWDELVTIVLPILVTLVVMRVTRRRAPRDEGGKREAPATGRELRRRAPEGDAGERRGGRTPGDEPGEGGP